LPNMGDLTFSTLDIRHWYVLTMEILTNDLTTQSCRHLFSSIHSSNRSRSRWCDMLVLCSSHLLLLLFKHEFLMLLGLFLLLNLVLVVALNYFEDLNLEAWGQHLVQDGCLVDVSIKECFVASLWTLADGAFNAFVRFVLCHLVTFKDLSLFLSFNHWGLLQRRGRGLRWKLNRLRVMLSLLRHRLRLRHLLLSG